MSRRRASDPATKSDAARPSRPGPVWVVVLLAILGAALLGGCGPDLQQSAEPLPSGALPSASSPAPSEAQQSRETAIYFVNGPQLEGVAEPITDRTAAGVMAALIAGPPADRQEDLRTLLLDPLTAEPLLSVTRVTPEGVVILRHTDAYLQTPPIDQVLLMGQVVRSMAEVGLRRVLLTDSAGQLVPVALPDGRVREGAVTPTDYRSLLVAS